MIPNNYMSSNSLKVEENEAILDTRVVLKSLSDGNWHKIEDLEAETEMEKETLLRIVNFFRDYQFVEISVGGEAAKLDKDYIKL
jgi:hypothetical protein